MAQIERRKRPSKRPSNGMQLGVKWLLMGVMMAVLPLFIGSCALGTGNDKNSGSKGSQGVDKAQKLTVTIEPLRYFAQAIAGDRYEVVSMVPQGSSPETYDPVPQQLIDLSDSQAYLMIGHIGFERSWQVRLAQNAPGLRFYDTSVGVDFIYGSEHEHHHGGHDGAASGAIVSVEDHDGANVDENGGNKDETGGIKRTAANESAKIVADHAHKAADHAHKLAIEPHIWNSPTNARIIVSNLVNALTELDVSHAEAYQHRADSLLEVISQTDSIVRGILSRPGADRAFLIYHPALSYFAREYGLQQLAIEADGKEPSPAHLAHLIEDCRRAGVRVVFVQPEFDRRNAELIAKQIGARIVPINPLAYDWPGELVRTAEALAHRSSADFSRTVREQAEGK